MFEHLLSNLLFLLLLGHHLSPMILLVHSDYLSSEILLCTKSCYRVEDREGEADAVLEEHVRKDVYIGRVEKLCQNHVACVSKGVDEGEEKWK